MGGGDLQRARRARRRLRAAGWITVAAGALIAVTALLLAPFFFPFGLAAGALAMLAGWQLVRLRGALGAVLAGGASLVVAGTTALSSAGSPAGILGPVLAGALGACSVTVLVIVYTDAGHLPSARHIEND